MFMSPVRITIPIVKKIGVTTERNRLKVAKYHRSQLAEDGLIGKLVTERSRKKRSRELLDDLLARVAKRTDHHRSSNMICLSRHDEEQIMTDQGDEERVTQEYIKELLERL